MRHLRPVGEQIDREVRPGGICGPDNPGLHRWIRRLTHKAERQYVRRALASEEWELAEETLDGIYSGWMS
jgi:hypothetical protein